MKHGSRVNGTSAAAHCSYILREQRYEYGAHELIHSESENLPKWATSVTDFWDAADEFEAVNARLYSEFEIALPRELTSQQQIRLVRDFVQAEIGDRHPYTWAIHEPNAQDGKPNPHVHVMFTSRSLADGIEREREVFFKRANRHQPEQGGAPKDRQWMAKERLLDLRESWETHANRALKRAGHSAVIDHRSLEAQGVDRPAEPKLSPYESMLWKQGIFSEKVEELLLIRELVELEKRQATNIETLQKLQEIGKLRDFEDRVGATLEKEQKLLREAITEREQTDSRIKTLDEYLSDAPGSLEDAFDMAQDRLFGRAIDAHVRSIEHWQEERDRIAKDIESQVRQGWGVISDLPHIFQESKEFFHAHQMLHAARNAYRELMDDTSTSETKEECNSFAERLYASKVTYETERNALLETAFSLRDEIPVHEKTILDLERMLAELQKERYAIESTLSPVVRMWIYAEEDDITIGQEARIEQEHPSHQKRELKQQLSMKLSHDSDPV